MTVAQYRRESAAIADRLTTIVEPILRLVGGRPSPRKWRALMAAIYPVVYRARGDSFRSAEQFYARQRDLVIGRLPAPPAISMRRYPPEALSEALTIPLRRRLDALDEGDLVSDLVVSSTSSVLKRHALEAGRAGVVDIARHDPQALGYARVPTGASTCAFCIMLVSRGPVYKSESAALLRSGTSEPYHNHCDCVASPVFAADDWAGKKEYEEAKVLYDKAGSLSNLRDVLS